MTIPVVPIEVLRTINLVVTWLWFLVFTSGIFISAWAASDAWNDWRSVLSEGVEHRSTYLYVQGRWHRQLFTLLVMTSFWSAGFLALVQRVTRARMSPEAAAWMGLFILLLLVAGGVLLVYKNLYDRVNGLNIMKADAEDTKQRNRRAGDGDIGSGTEVRNGT